ncbi:MAG: response regulator [Lachnospiraceae bacterium]|nr:response regulator [Lachnospiraceae bacterium]
MYRVMIIDDEISARNLMKVSVDWDSLGMQVVGEAGSGIEAINIIDEVKPDIAIVDISMPFMNGIEFTEMASKTYPELAIIIMTAMDDFEYARKCVSLPVFEYMLKPIVRADVTATLKKLKDKLDKRRAELGWNNKDEANEPDMDRSMIDKIKSYIEKNYKDSKINLTSVAQRFGFSSSYLSRRFKQETGKNFIEYLTECRMERAMMLARGNYKMFSTSNEVGIPDTAYFGKCFKKYTGMSYSEYVLSQKGQ